MFTFCGFTVCSFLLLVYLQWDMLAITLLLRMIYVLWLVLDGSSCRGGGGACCYLIIRNSMLGLILLNPLLPWVAVPRR